MEESTAPEVDSFAADVFDSPTVEEPSSEALDSWDDAESYQPEEPTQEEQPSEESQDETTDESAEDSESSEEAESESSDADSEQSDEDGAEDSEESFELPEQLTEKGLVQQDGEVGKIVKIDGEDQFVSLDELGNDYSGQKVINQRFNEISQREKTHEGEVAEVESYIDEFGQHIREGNTLGAFQYFGQFAGIPPYQIERQLIEQLAPKIQEMSQMTAQELQAKYAQEENEYLKQSIESERESYAAQQADMELQAEIRSVREAHGIEDSEWDQAVAYLQEHEAQIRQENPDLVMDANFVAEAILEHRAYDRAETAFESVQLVNLSEQQKTGILESLHEVAVRNPDFTQEDLVDLVKTAHQSALADKTSKSVGKRVEKHGSKPKPKPTENNQSLTPEEETYLEDIWG